MILARFINLRCASVKESRSLSDEPLHFLPSSSDKNFVLIKGSEEKSFSNPINLKRVDKRCNPSIKFQVPSSF